MLMDAGGPERIRTSDTWFRKPLLYPLSYGAKVVDAREASASSIPDADSATQTPANGREWRIDGAPERGRRMVY